MASTSTCYLPEDIIFIILSLILPVKSLVRFSLVCKSWQSIISNKKFIQAQLENSQKKKPSSILQFARVSNKMVVSMDTQECSVKLNMPPQFNDYIWSIRSCNGLVCFSNACGDVVYIWNPMTRRFKILPAPNKRRYYYLGLAFGYDSVCDDNKVVRFFMSEDIRGLCKLVLAAELYSVNDDSWKEIVVPKILERFQPVHRLKSVYTKTGLVFLKGFDGLLSFDLHNEVFGFYPYPCDWKRKLTILDFEGSVAMIFESRVHDGISVPSLWMLDDVCGRLSWIRKYDLDFDYENYRRVEYLYLGVGQFVAVNNAGYIYYEYGSRKKEIKKFDPQMILKPIMISYNGSLVSLKGFEKQE